MTLQNLSKILDKYEQQLGYSSSSIQQFVLLKGLPFYNWQCTTVNDSLISAKSELSFNHAIGLPQKNGVSYPLFDYERMLFDTLQSNKHVWIKKATGLGVTEFMLRYMAWLCFSSQGTQIEGKNVLSGSQMCIVTGPRIELAITLIDRLKGLFTSGFASGQTTVTKSVSFDTKETVIELNGVHIEAYPSHHLDAMRGLVNVSFIYLDESDFFPPGQQQDARDVSERYICKSDPHIVMVSTPNAPEGLFERIENEPENTCLYKRIFLDYTYGINRIYLPEEIEKAKVSPSFEREYNLKYLGLIGNVFHWKDIEAAILKGRKIFTSSHRITNSAYTDKAVGLDPGFGSSNFGVCITEVRDGIVNVLHAEEYSRPDYNTMIQTTISLLDKYGITRESGCRIYTDGSNSAFTSSLKRAVYEDPDYTRQIEYLKKTKPSVFDFEYLKHCMFVLPVHFSKEHKAMLAHCKEILEDANGMIAINPKFTKLVTALRTAVENGEGSLDKEATSHDDLFDAFRMSLMHWRRRQRRG